MFRKLQVCLHWFIKIADSILSILSLSLIYPFTLFVLQNQVFLKNYKLFSTYIIRENIQVFVFSIFFVFTFFDIFWDLFYKNDFKLFNQYKISLGKYGCELFLQHKIFRIKEGKNW